MTNNIRVALVIDANEGYDEQSSVQVVDLIGIQPLDTNIFIIQTQPFNSRMLKNGAGQPLTPDHLQDLFVKSFFPTKNI